MPHFLIHAPGPGNPRWQVRLADCTQEHAESVLAQLEADSGCPAGCQIVELEHPYGEPPPPRLSWWRRLLRRIRLG